MNTETNKKIAEAIEDQVDWLIDAIGGATQNRMFLRGDPEEDKVTTEAIVLNGRKAMKNLAARIVEAMS